MAESDSSVLNTEPTRKPHTGPTTWKPGIPSPNPKGRPPKDHSITDTIKAMMDEKPEIKRALGQKILQMALEGDVVAMKTLWNYMDGMPIQKNELTGENGEGIIFKMINYGIQDPIQLPTNAIHDSNSSRPAPLSSPQLASQGPENNISDQPTDPSRV